MPPLSSRPLVILVVVLHPLGYREADNGSLGEHVGATDRLLHFDVAVGCITSNGQQERKKMGYALVGRVLGSVTILSPVNEVK